jgi:hypothetical protein
VQSSQWQLSVVHYSRKLSALNCTVWEHHADHDRDDNGNHNGDHDSHDVFAHCHTNSDPYGRTIGRPNRFPFGRAECRTDIVSRSPSYCVTQCRSVGKPNRGAHSNAECISNRDTQQCTKRIAKRSSNGLSICCSERCTNGGANIDANFTYWGTKCKSDNVPCGVSDCNANGKPKLSSYQCTDCCAKRGADCRAVVVTDCIAHRGAECSTVLSTDGDTNSCSQRNSNSFTDGPNCFANCNAICRTHCCSDGHTVRS